MPYILCPACGLTSYSAAGRSTHDYCPRCDASLEPLGRPGDPIRRWDLTALRRAAPSKELEYGTR
jgi:hypothetical protein